MKAKEVSVGVEKTINIGNYENVKVSVHTTVVLEDGETADSVTGNVFDWAKSKIADQEAQVRTTKAKARV